MLASSIVVSILTIQLQIQARHSAIKAHRTDILLKTTQKLQTCKSVNEIFGVIATQIVSLLD